jgi:hypothetical protein
VDLEMNERIDPARDIWRPLGVVALGLLPFVVFVGTKSSTTINGEVVQREEVNLAGLALAIAGLILAFKVLPTPGSNRVLRSAIAGVGAVLCLVQLPLSVDLFSDDDPEQLSAAGEADNRYGDEGGELSENNARIARDQIANNDIETAYEVVRLGLTGIVTDTRRHIAYADRCHDGESELDLADATVYPDFITPDDVTLIESDFEQMYPAFDDIGCSETNTEYYMGELVDSVEHLRLMLEVEIETYLEVHGSGPP